MDLEAVRERLLRGRYLEAEAALERDPRPDDPLWLRLKGWARWHLGDEGGLELVRKAARVAREGAGWAWQDLGALLFRAGRWEEAGAALRRALDLFTAEEDHLGRAWALHGLGVVHLHQGRPGWALRRGEEALAVVRGKALGRFRGRVLLLLSSAHRARGELREALFRLEQALEGRLDPDDRAVALRDLGTTLRLMGQPAQGREALEAALVISQEGARRGAALADLAACYLALGWRRMTRKTVGEALGLLGTHAPARARALVVLAELSRREASRKGNPGDPEAGGAVRLLEEALEVGPYPLMEEALAFPQLFALGEARGLALPRTRRAPERPMVRLDTGERRLWVGRREVALEGSGFAFELMVLLAREGPLHWAEAAYRLWEERGAPGLRKRLHTTVSRARDLVADREAVRWREEVVELDSRRRWEVV